MAITKSKSHLFQKGHNLSKGRPKGCYNEHKKKFLEIQKLAADDAKAVYNEVRQKMREGESWAYQIYYKELYSLPKRFREETIKIDTIPVEQLSNINAYINAVTKGLVQFDELTHEEALATLKTLASIKINETLVETAATERQSREELMEKINAIQKVIDYEEKN